MRKNRRIRFFATMLALSIGMLTQPLTAAAMTPLQTRQCNAEILLEAAEYAKAEAESTALLQQDANNSRLYMNRAKARAEQNNLEGAFQDYRQAILLVQARPDAEKWYSTVKDAVEESSNYAIANMKYGLWLQYFSDLTIHTPEGQSDYAEAIWNQSKDEFQAMEAVFAQLPPALKEIQMADILQSEDYQEIQKLRETSRREDKQREQQRQAALAGMNQSFYSEQDATTVRYGGTGVQLTDKDEWTQMFILSQPMRSAQCSSHELVCYVPAGTQVQLFVTGIAADGYGYAHFGNKYTIGAGETVKLLDDSQDTGSYYCLTMIGV